MQIENVKITNFKGIESLGVELGGRSVFVVGGNAAGKTSFISAIFLALTGKNMPPNPIKGTARTAKIEVEMDGFAVELEFKKKGKKIEKKLSLFSTADGEKIESPRARLDQIIGNLEFDPFEFMRMQPTPQLNYFCKVFKIDGVNALNMDIQEINEVVTYEKKRLASVSGNFEFFDPKTAELEIQSLSNLNNDYLAAVEYNRTTEDFRIKMQSQKARREEIFAEIELLKAEAEVCTDNATKGEFWIRARVERDEAELKEKLDNLEETNEEIKKAQENKTLSDEIDKIEVTLETAKTEKAAKITEKKALIASHTKAIEGFDYDETLGFTLNGLPFHIDQNNTAAQIVAGLKLGAGLLGDVKIARFEGSLLDQESLDAVSAFAEAEGLQLFVELVDRNEKELRLEFSEDTQNETTKTK